MKRMFILPVTALLAASRRWPIRRPQKELPVASCDKSVRRAYVVFAGALAVICLLGLPTAASADLRLLKPNPADPATFSGKGGYSTDGLGQNGVGGTVQAQVPAGSTVVQAYLYGTYSGGGVDDPAQRVIDFDGTNVTLEKLTYAGPYDFSGLGTARANVTSQVAAKVGGGGGTTNFVIGNDPPNLDGVALVVIFSNPSLPETTVAVLDGGANTSGDTATFSFVSPIDPTASGFSAEMGVGSGFSFQGASGNACGGGQFSVIDVNEQRLTNCAGNFDDGEGNDGALITVGGVGDSLDNPTPPDDPPTDDELYNLKPFLKTGDTQLKINTVNPSGDDNLFLAVIAVTAQARVTTEICDNGVDDDGDGLVDGDDPDCAPPPPQCSDTFDNDSDGKTDFPDDPGCSSANDNSESPDPPPPPKQCADGRDNDNDGKVDFPADRGCSSANDNSESPDPPPPPTKQCTINGTRGNDIIRGTSGNDVICAGAGNDIVDGKGGNDIVIAGAGNDILRGGDGDDRLVGGAGRDGLSGQEGSDFLDTRDNRRGNDVANGGPGADDCETDRGDARSSC